MSPRNSRSKQPPKPWELALKAIDAHYLLGAVRKNVSVGIASQRRNLVLAPHALCQIEGQAAITLNDAAKLTAAQWEAVIALCLLMLAHGVPAKLAVPDPLTDLAGQLVALNSWQGMKIGDLPERLNLPPEMIQWGRLPLPTLVQRLRDELALGDRLLESASWSLSGAFDQALLVPGPAAIRWQGWSSTNIPIDHQQVFAQALVDNAKKALQMQHEASHPQTRASSPPNSNAAKAKRWLIAHFPLLGGLLTQFDLIEDAQICHQLDIHIAAIRVDLGEIYINPARQLSIEQAKFVIAHEILHAGLNHASRRHGRDRYLWNVACDFVINDWLLAMQIGAPPPDGLLLDDALRGWSADDIYTRLAADLRIRRKLNTLRGHDVDMLDDAAGRLFTDREAFYRHALLQGLDYQITSGRGTLPAGLVEAIRTLNQPPIPWQAKLAEWIQERFPLPDRQRSYARPSRRQSSTPDTPRPRFIEPDDQRATRTFGVVLDTSGSMQRDDLGKALGAIVSYSAAQSVRQIRLVYCDAMPYDEGYVPVEALAGRVQVKGRGGTELQPAIDLLESRQDFPKDAPVLVITDGGCEAQITIKRDHAFLVSGRGRLPFGTRMPVFWMR